MKEVDINSLAFPLKISSIKVQKKNKSRFSIYTEEKFLVGVSDHSLVKFNLKKNGLITKEIYESIYLEEENWAIREYLIRLLSRRDHSKSELITKAIKKGYSKNLVSPILDELEEKKYINHAEFAKKFVHDKFNFNKWGIQKIKTELFKKGITEKDINQAILNGPSKETRSTQLIDLVLKQKAKFLRTDKFKRKKKIFDYLIRKGYDSSLILAEIENLLSLIDEEHNS